MRLLLWLCLALLPVALAFSAWSQQRSTRLALVIGNAEYVNATTQPSTAVADAKALTAELQRSGFDVDLKTNLGKLDMQSAIDAFTNKISSGMSVLFYFSGFGAQVDRLNYLFPVNSNPWRAADVPKDGISVDSVLAQMHDKGAKVKILIIDATRRNPFERRFRMSLE